MMDHRSSLSPVMRRVSSLVFLVWTVLVFPAIVVPSLIQCRESHDLALDTLMHLLFAGFLMLSLTDKPISFPFFQVFNAIAFGSFVLWVFSIQEESQLVRLTLAAAGVLVFSSAAYFRYRLWVSWKIQNAQPVLGDET